MSTKAEKEGEAEPSWALRIAIGGPVVLVVLYAAAILWGQPAGLAELGQLGDAFAPLTVAFSIAAVAVALRSVELQKRELRLQRKELRLQRAELRDTREEMKAQRGQFERTAKAQEELAASQKRLADAQEAATRISQAESEVSEQKAYFQLAANVATLEAARAHLRGVIAASWNPSDGHVRASHTLQGDLLRLDEAIAEAKRLRLRRPEDE